MTCGVILYGPPASGKDTIDAALRRLSPRYRHFPRLKAGPGRTDGYRMTTDDELQILRNDGSIVWENHRYGATYAVDLPSLTTALADGVPIIHLGQPEAITAVQAATDAKWITVSLTTSRDIAAERLARRGPADLAARLAAWDETSGLDRANLRIDTGQVAPEDAACQIDAAVLDC